LTVEMAARLQGFPEDWHFVGRKTHAYRQVGNAFPPPVAEAVGLQIAEAIAGAAGKKRSTPADLRASLQRELDAVAAAAPIEVQPKPGKRKRDVA
jgi:hypothetical protein